MVEMDSMADPSRFDSEELRLEEDLVNLIIVLGLAMKNLNERRSERDETISNGVSNAIGGIFEASSLDGALKTEIYDRALKRASAVAQTERSSETGMQNYEGTPALAVIRETGGFNSNVSEEGGGRCFVEAPSNKATQTCAVRYEEETDEELTSLDHSRSVNALYSAKILQASDDTSLLVGDDELILFLDECNPFAPFSAAFLKATQGQLSLAALELVGVQFGTLMQDTIAVAMQARRAATETTRKDFSCPSFDLPISFALIELEVKEGSDAADERDVTPTEEAAKRAAKRHLGEKKAKDGSWKKLSKLKAPQKCAFSTVGHVMVGVRLYVGVTFARLYAVCGEDRKEQANALARLGLLICHESILSFPMSMVYECVLIPSLAKSETFYAGLKAAAFISSAMSSWRLNDDFKEAEMIPWIESTADNDEHGNSTAFKPYFSATDENGRPTVAGNNRKRRCNRLMMYSLLATHAAKALVSFRLSEESVPDFIDSILTMPPSKFTGSDFAFLLDENMYNRQIAEKDGNKMAETTRAMIKRTKSTRKQLCTTPVFYDITNDVKEESRRAYQETLAYFAHLEETADVEDLIE